MDEDLSAEHAHQECLEKFHMFRPVVHTCGHVNEIHHNNLALEDKHFAVLERIKCPWCAARDSGLSDELVEQAAKYHGHMKFWGELVAFRRSDLSVSDWQQLQDMEQQLLKGGTDGVKEA